MVNVLSPVQQIQAAQQQAEQEQQARSLAFNPLQNRIAENTGPDNIHEELALPNSPTDISAVARPVLSGNAGPAPTPAPQTPEGHTNFLESVFGSSDAVKFVNTVGAIPGDTLKSAGKAYDRTFQPKGGESDRLKTDTTDYSQKVKEHNDAAENLTAQGASLQQRADEYNKRAATPVSTQQQFDALNSQRLALERETAEYNKQVTDFQRQAADLQQQQKALQQREQSYNDPLGLNANKMGMAFDIAFANTPSGQAINRLQQGAGKTAELLNEHLVKPVESTLNKPMPFYNFGNKDLNVIANAAMITANNQVSGGPVGTPGRNLRNDVISGVVEIPSGLAETIGAGSGALREITKVTVTKPQMIPAALAYGGTAIVAGTVQSATENPVKFGVQFAILDLAGGGGIIKGAPKLASRGMSTILKDISNPEGFLRSSPGDLIMNKIHEIRGRDANFTVGDVDKLGHVTERPVGAIHGENGKLYASQDMTGIAKSDDLYQPPSPHTPIPAPEYGTVLPPDELFYMNKAVADIGYVDNFVPAAARDEFKGRVNRMPKTSAADDQFIESIGGADEPLLAMDLGISMSRTKQASQTAFADKINKWSKFYGGTGVPLEYIVDTNLGTVKGISKGLDKVDNGISVSRAEALGSVMSVAAGTSGKAVDKPAMPFPSLKISERINQVSNNFTEVKSAEPKINFNVGTIQPVTNSVKDITVVRIRVNEEQKNGTLEIPLIKQRQMQGDITSVKLRDAVIPKFRDVQITEQVPTTKNKTPVRVLPVDSEKVKPAKVSKKKGKGAIIHQNPLAAAEDMLDVLGISGRKRRR